MTEPRNHGTTEGQGESSIAPLFQSGAIINSQIVNHVRDVIDTDRRLTVRENSKDIGISKTSVHMIIRENT